MTGAAEAFDHAVIATLGDRDIPPITPDLNLATKKNFIKLDESSYQPVPYIDSLLIRRTPIAEMSGGKVEIHMARLKDGQKWEGAPLHYHDVNVQIIYIVKGWMRFFFEGVGEVTLEAGTFIYQPTRNRHREIATSDDIEIMEIIIPDEISTTIITPKDDGSWESIDMSKMDLRKGPE